LLVGGAGDEIYRLDLAEGRFKAPLVCPVGAGVNKLEAKRPFSFIIFIELTAPLLCFEEKRRRKESCFSFYSNSVSLVAFFLFTLPWYLSSQILKIF